MSRIRRIKEILGINPDTDKEDLQDRHKEIVEEIEEQDDG